MNFSLEKRSLKRPRMGPPDVYPQDPKQKEVRNYIYAYDIFISIQQFIYDNTVKLTMWLILYISSHFFCFF
jgi:hypothetical protein